MVATRGKARVRHATTGVVYDIEPRELDWEEVGADDREMGVEITYLAAVEHPDLGSLTWWLWEYPVGMENDRETDVGPHELVDNFSISLSDGFADEDDEEDPAARVDDLIEWFNDNFEDPARRTPYSTAEGGYEWIWGGPYDAREELSSQFPDEDEAIIDAAVKRLERHVVDWAPRDQGEGDGAGEGPDEEYQLDPYELAVTLDAMLGAIEDTDPGPVFDIDASGRIELLGWHPEPPETPEAPSPLLLELQGAVAEVLLALEGTNAHPDLLRSVQQYNEAVCATQVVVSRIYARGVALEIADDVARAAIKAEERPPLSDEAGRSLRTTLALHAGYIMATDEGRNLADGAAAYHRPVGTNRAAQQAAERLSRSIDRADDLFGPIAQAAARQAAATIGAGPNPDRSNQVAGQTLGKLIKAIGKGVLAVGGTLALEALIGSQVGAAAIHMGSAAIDGVCGFLVANLPDLQTVAALTGTELNWLNQVTRLVLAIRRRP